MDEVLDIASELARDFEGLSLDPYYDPVGYPTIGYGHLLCKKSWDILSQWKSVSKNDAIILLQDDMQIAYNSVQRLITVDLNDNQQAALVDFAFNCGGGNLQASTLRRVINRGALHEAPRQFKRWVYANGISLRGLVRRRAAEAELFVSG